MFKFKDSTNLRHSYTKKELSRPSPRWFLPVQNLSELNALKRRFYIKKCVFLKSSVLLRSDTTK